MAQINEISSLRMQDPAVARATRPRRFKYVNPSFYLFALLLVGYGLIVQFSATSADADYSFARQLSGVAVGMVLFVLITRMDYHVLSGYTTLFLIINVVLLLSPHLPGIGVEVNGGRSWINIGTQIQPGEFAKITMVLLAASVMARYGGRLTDLREYLKALGIMAVPFVCVMTQPDLGTGLVYLVIAAFALIIGGLAFHGGHGSYHYSLMRRNLDYRPYCRPNRWSRCTFKGLPKVTFDGVLGLYV